MLEKTETAQKDFREIVRVGDKDVGGKFTIFAALKKVKGCGFMLSNAICNILGINTHEKIGNLSTDQTKKIEECLRNPTKYNIPNWMLNRRKDRETGEDAHLISNDLILTKQFDVRHLKKIRCYRGARHARGLKVRGQRTRSTGRKGTTIGVKRKKK